MNRRTTDAVSLRERDETAWLEQTAALVAQRRFDEIDPHLLSEYLTEMARRDKREVLSRLTVLLAHLLKWEHQVDKRGSSWEATIYHQRQELRDLLENKTLENYAHAIFDKAFQRALKEVALECAEHVGVFPAASPWTLDEVLANE